MSNYSWNWLGPTGKSILAGLVAIYRLPILLLCQEAPEAQLVRVSEYSEGPGFNHQLGPVFFRDFFTLRKLNIIS